MLIEITPRIQVAIRLRDVNEHANIGACPPVPYTDSIDTSLESQERRIYDLDRH
jgi:hypothetical protein